MELDNNVASAELSNQKNRAMLLEKIAILKTYVSLLEGITEAPKSRQSQLTEIQSNLLCNSGVIIDNISDVQSHQNCSTELYHDISQITEMPCVKIEKNMKFFFEIDNVKNISKKDQYEIEILIDDNGHGKLGKCLLPDFIDVHNILSRHPIDDLNNVKHFLKSCKHRIDCYYSRLKQIDELERLFQKVENADISYNYDITLIEITMIGVKDMDTTKLYDVTLYLYYNLDETRPYKLSSTVDDFEVLLPALIRKFNWYFEPFLKMDLTSALLRISEFRNKFVWEILMEEDEDDIEIFYKDEMIHYLYRGDKVIRSNESETHTQNESKEDGSEKKELNQNEMEI
ncbi:uncharacterized protein LOC105839957 [Monomorium pharaonis]|uniref:uncharacterized protein LOC105839957 n=1 Tax=Monomorium pharaonis TaxID=307658 RepID=UPI0017469696|nr:uncharacterized protein LOC105839957 [Monomorium pharaonis]XP_028046548.2 uncharacterized protein LOC105839957 [Monomorium pharaonis]